MLSRIIQQKAALGYGYFAYRGHIVYETEEVGGDDAEKAIVRKPLQARMVDIELCGSMSTGNILNPHRTTAAGTEKQV